MSFVILKEARKDIRGAFNHIRTDNLENANHFMEVIEQTFLLIQRNNKIGRPSGRGDIREWSIPNWPYVVPYRLRGTDIEIMRVWHTRRDRPDIW